MKIGFDLTDYKIQSESIYRFTLMVFGILLTAILLTEIILDLKATSIEVLLPFMGGLFVTIAFSIKNPTSKESRIVFISLLYLMIEIHFLYQPTIFHTIIFWFPFVPLLALIISGTRSSVIWLGILLVTLFLNGFYLFETIGDSYAIEVFSLPVLVSGIIFTLAISTNSFILYHLLGKAYTSADLKKNELEKIKARIEHKRSILEHYLREFIRFSRDDSNFNQGQPHLFKEICYTISTILKVSRVSIWIFNEEQTAITRQYLCEDGEEKDDIIKLDGSLYPNYFKALKSEPYIIAQKARTHEFTKEFTESYLEPLDIYSMLDCPIMVDRTPIGVICCEHQNKIKNWNVEDALFLQSVSDFISMSFKNQRIERLMDELKQTNSELKAKNREIEVMNAALDSTVQKRTKALKSQTAQITEYSFINSHLVRAPLTRIMGLSKHLAEDAPDIKKHYLFNALIESSEELDTILKKINHLLYSGNGLTRKDLISIENDMKTKKS
ncbi:GAF domain-containing protein [Ekhidna sp.]|uniref:GAF domain-containing protein n=1 Tax=Ekhidna sp. TaxID=2608089 RepID=UPI003B50164F